MKNELSARCAFVIARVISGFVVIVLVGCFHAIQSLYYGNTMGWISIVFLLVAPFTGVMLLIAFNLMTLRKVK